MRKSEGIALRLDDSMRAAIEDLGKRLGTDNISAIVRVGFMSGYKEIANIPEAITRQSFREGILRGVASFKARIETAISEAFADG